MRVDRQVRSGSSLTCFIFSVLPSSLYFSSYAAKFSHRRATICHQDLPVPLLPNAVHECRTDACYAMQAVSANPAVLWTTGAILVYNTAARHLAT